MSTPSEGTLEVFLPDEAATVTMGQRLGLACMGGAVVYLAGTLGAGKTTLTRGVLQAFGHSGAVKSPTYTLVEMYELAEQTVYHFDLYRLADPEELEYMGIRDYFSKHNLLVVEWPSRGEGFLPGPDLSAEVSVIGEGRQITIRAHSSLGTQILQRLNAN